MSAITIKKSFIYEIASYFCELCNGTSYYNTDMFFLLNITCAALDFESSHKNEFNDNSLTS